MGIDGATGAAGSDGGSRPGRESESERDVAGGGGCDGSGMGGGVAVGKTATPPARATGRYTCVVGCEAAAEGMTEGRLWWLESLRSDPDGLPGLLKQSAAWPPPSLLVRFSGGRSSSVAAAASSAPEAEEAEEECFRLRVEFQWFLMALSVRPERSLAMVAHLLSNLAWARRMVSSSSGVKGRCSTCGESWLHHRRRHDLPDRPGMDLLMRDQLRAPWRPTRRCSASSSSGLQGPLIRSTSLAPPSLHADDMAATSDRSTSKEDGTNGSDLIE